jgi:hypothetical protein
MTVTQRISALATFIATNNTYFDKYFEYAIQDPKEGIINDTFQAIFPEDSYSNYFYVRYPHNGITFDMSNSNMLADGGGGAIGFVYPLILVACVHDANEGVLLQNLINTIGKYCQGNAKLTKANWGPATIIQELSGTDEQTQKSALQKLPANMSVVSLSFTFTVPFVYQKLSCIKNPCNDC